MSKARKKYFSPACEPHIKKPFKDLMEYVNDERVKAGKFIIKTDGDFIYALTKNGEENIHFLVSL